MYARKGSVDNALVDYNEAIWLDSGMARVYYRHGIAYNRKGDMDHAIADYSEVIHLDPVYTEAYINRGASYGNKGDIDSASRILKRPCE